MEENKYINNLLTSFIYFNNQKDNEKNAKKRND